MSFSEEVERHPWLQDGEAQGDWRESKLKGLDDIRPMIGQMGNLVFLCKVQWENIIEK